MTAKPAPVKAAKKTVKASKAAKRVAPVARKAAKAARPGPKLVRTGAAKATAPGKTPAAPRKGDAGKAAAPRRGAGTVVKRAAPVVGKIAKVAAPVARKAPSLSRERRTVQDEDAVVPSPPSTLDLDRTASAARSGRRELRERFDQHTETGPALTGGDVDADWESAYSVGDEAPGGDTPTPDQDIVDDIGRAVGIEYQDNEELKSEDKLIERDKHRWELDPASSDDYDER